MRRSLSFLPHPKRISRWRRVIRPGLWALTVVLLSASTYQALRQTTPIAPGVTYSAERHEQGPWEIRTIALERQAPCVRLDMALGGGRLRGVEPLSAIIARETSPDDVVVAAVNDDFFVMAPHPNAGLVSGLCVRRGELIMMARGQPAFVLQEDGTPRIGVFDTQGYVEAAGQKIPVAGLNQPPGRNGLYLYTAIYGWPVASGCVVVTMDGLPLRLNGEWHGYVREIVPAGVAREAQGKELLLVGEGSSAAALGELKLGCAVQLRLETPALPQPVAMAAGGGPILLQAGQIIVSEGPRAPRHPRTAIGFNERQIFLVTVDGRQPGWSVGMTLGELARLMQRLGCTEALNLDGGGSTTAWIRGEIVNRPSDGRERPIANAILVRSTAPAGPLSRLLVAPTKIIALSGAEIPLTLKGVDEAFNPRPVPTKELIVLAEPKTPGGRLEARWREGRLLVKGSAGEGLVRFGLRKHETARAELSVRLVKHCARLAIRPDPIVLCAGESWRLSASGSTEEDEPVVLPAGRIQWHVYGRGLTLVGNLLRADREGVAGRVEARLGAAVGEAAVRVAAEEKIEDFEEAFRPVCEWTPAARGISGRLTLGSIGAIQGKRYCRLAYDLGEARGTRAVYIRLNRPLGQALRLSLWARAQDAAPWLRLAVVDGNGTRQTYTLAERGAWGKEWRKLTVRLPMGLKPPLTWQSVYVVALEGQTSRGVIAIDDLRAEQIGL